MKAQGLSEKMVELPCIRSLCSPPISKHNKNTVANCARYSILFACIKVHSPTISCRMIETSIELILSVSCACNVVPGSGTQLSDSSIIR